MWRPWFGRRFGRGFRGAGWRGAWGPRVWPGNGPWSHLPPWERPGWKYGRGWCWQYFYDFYEDKNWLREYRDYLRRELDYVEKQLQSQDPHSQ